MKEANLRLQEEWRLNMENNLKIDRCEVMKLYESCISSLSVHSIGQWLKVATNDTFVVVPKEYITVNNLAIGRLTAETGVLIASAEELNQWM